MSKKQRNFFYLTVLALVFLMVGGCGKKTENQAGNNNQVQVNQEEGVVIPSGEHTINELIDRKRPMKCSWSEQATNGSEVSNVIYINGEKFYQDVTVGDLGHSYAVSDGQYVYTWNSFTSTAVKINLKEVRNISEQGGTLKTNNDVLGRTHNFVCEKWSGDNSIFVPPTDKDFKDMNQQMEQAEQNIDNYEQACELCKRASTKELREQCAKNFGCN